MLYSFLDFLVFPYLFASKPNRVDFFSCIAAAPAPRWNSLLDIILDQVYCSAVARTITSPLDVAKIAQQFTYSPQGTWWSNLLSFRDVHQALQGENPLLFFFKGNGAAIWRVFPYVVVKALVTDFVARRVYIDGPMLAVLGTTAAVLVTHPLDTVKNRLTIQSWNSYYHGTWHALWTIFQEEGAAGLWAGWFPAVLAALPFEGLAVYIRHMIHRIFIQPRPVQNAGIQQQIVQQHVPEELNQQEEPVAARPVSFLLDTILWGISSCAAQSISIPIDLVKKRLQVQSPKFQDGWHWPPYEGMLDGFNEIIKQEGYSALFKGVVYNHVKTLFFSFFQRAILKVLEEKTQDMTHQQRRRHLTWIYICSVTPLLGLELYLGFSGQTRRTPLPNTIVTL